MSVHSAFLARRKTARAVAVQSVFRLFQIMLLVTLAAMPVRGERLMDVVGRREYRIYSDAFPLVSGRTVAELRLEERLKRLGYRRIRKKPSAPGTYFWSHRTFWIYQREHQHRGKKRGARLFGLDLRKADGMIQGARDADGKPIEIGARGKLWLEPELLAESLEGERAARLSFALSEVPEHVWRPLLAAEDARFFDHLGLDGRALARSTLANIKAGKVVQGGSTITQQLIKNRDLTPKRTFGRKASEAWRAVRLEALYSKKEILETYLNHVYLGHVSGLAVHGYGTGARVFFDKSVADLSLAEAATLAAMVQGPNRLSPIRNPDNARGRRDWVLERMESLGWATPAQVAAARAKPVRAKVRKPRRVGLTHFRNWIAESLAEEAPRRSAKNLGFVVSSAIDPLLQEDAERQVAQHLSGLRRRYSRLRKGKLSAALVALDAENGAVLAYVGGDPRDTGDQFDRVRKARRQPGSSIKPFILLEGFDRGWGKLSLNPSSRVADKPLTIDLPNGPWRPTNNDGRFHGVIDLRTALRHSYNVPFVRLGRHLGYGKVADRFREVGLPMPDDPGPAFLLGAIEVSPLELAAAYTVFATPGYSLEPVPIWRIGKPKGRRLERFRTKRDRISSKASAYLVADLLADVVAKGSGKAASIKGHTVRGKTGTSSNRRDAWFAGTAGSLVCVVWVGLDEGDSAGLTGGGAAATLWRTFMAKAIPARPDRQIERPSMIVEAWVDPTSGLLVKEGKKGAHKELFRRDSKPRRNRWWRIDRSIQVIE
ncbi:Peptidoglycan glycosyltransferase [Sulfidibacter corallicola]|uniref:Transglycosylase domain-containing protein n=1 Tax=Sulfidibacter corallicola TaxID=2818388 RepID=A0A8A4U1V8_SULCO|nr:transglycosylase domain-containing protein [Sulfidibacter corallicola]QTD52715.1 transglycosylase domain-containing protein [Sulfidibacter corallicola]